MAGNGCIYGWAKPSVTAHSLDYLNTAGRFTPKDILKCLKKRPRRLERHALFDRRKYAALDHCARCESLTRSRICW